MAIPMVHTVPPDAPWRSLATIRAGTLCPNARRTVENSKSTKPSTKGIFLEDANLSASIPAIGEARHEAAAYAARRFEMVV